MAEKAKVQVNWKRDVKPGIDKAFEFFNGEDVIPILRTLYYRLVSMKLIPHTDSAYNSLSSHMVKWRKDGFYAWDCLAETARTVVGTTDDTIWGANEIPNFAKEIEAKLEDMDVGSLTSEYFNYLFPELNHGLWANQPKLVEVWIEKEALSATLSAWLRDKKTVIRVNRGYSGWTFIYNNVRDIARILDRHEKVIIFYCGDHDPSGLDIDHFLQKSFDYFKVDPSRVEFRRVALTHEQTQIYELPPIGVNPKDPRATNYIEKYENKAWELDALVAYAPKKFKTELLGLVDLEFNDNIHKTNVEEREKLRLEALDVLTAIKRKAARRIKVTKPGGKKK